MSDSIDDFHPEFADAHVTVLSVLANDGIDQLNRLLAEIERERIVVLYDPGSIAVARALAANIPPSISLVVWKERAKLLLSAFRPNRHRIVFASASAVRAGLTQFRTSLLQHFKMSQEIGAISLPSPGPDWCAWQLVLANQALSADAEAVLLDQELTAAALPLAPILYDTDDAFSELQAAASLRALLLRQLANLRKEVSEQFLRATDKTTHSTIAENPDQLGRDKLFADQVETTGSVHSPVAASVTPITPTIGRVFMNQYMPIEQSDYCHFDISLYDVRDQDMRWEHIKFKLCSWKGNEYIEIRSGPGIPAMFHMWPGEKEDQYGPYLNYPEPFTREFLKISDRHDRRLLEVIFILLENVLEDVLSEADLEEGDRSDWREKTSRLVTNHREIMSASGVSDDVA